MTEIDTKTRILDAAETLFAVNGFGAVSLRAIIKEAGVNTASVHYHFGSKEGLIEAVLERRASPVNRRRLELLDKVEDRHPSGPLPLKEVVEAFLAPVVSVHRGRQAERQLLSRLLGRAITEPDAGVRRSLQSVMTDIFRRFSAAFRRALPGVSTEEVQMRIFFVVGALAFTVAGPHAFEDSAPAIRDHEIDRVTKSLVNFAVAGMSAAASSSDWKHNTE